MSAFVVACADCGTRFRVTDAQLAVAKGLVRCGACLAVFRAEEARVGDGAIADRDADRLHASRHRSVLASGDAVMPSATPSATPPAQHASALRTPESTSEAPPGSGPSDEASPPRERLDEGSSSPPGLVEASPPAEAEDLEAVLEAGRLAEEARPAGPWRAFAVVLALLAVAEVVWLGFDALADAPLTRPWVARLCSVAACALPERRDPRAIRSRSLVVRDHPSRLDGLRVDAVIVNDAPWPQSFPDVELRFSDMRGRLVAARRFPPREYLAGELAGQREMPMGAPVRISLDLLDPGPTAVNYEMQLH